MQSHASRHVASEFLKDRHPDRSPSFPKGIIKDEISVAFGRRGVQKLIAVLALSADDLPEEGDRAHALRVFLGLLTTQEQKLDAIAEGACAPVTALVRTTSNAEVLSLACETLGSLSQVFQGKLSIVEAGGVEALTEALKTSPEAAAGALRSFSMSDDGVSLLNRNLEALVPCLVALVDRNPADGVSIRACESAVATLASLASTDTGILSCLTHHVPRCVVALIDRGLKGDLQLEKGLMDCLEQSAACLEQVGHHAYGKTAVRAADGVRALGEVLALGRWSPPVQKQVSAALMAVSVEKESKVQVVKHAGESLVRLLKSDNAELSSNARSALTSACEHLEARAMINALVPEPDQVKLLFQGPVPPSPPDFRYNVVLPSC